MHDINEITYAVGTVSRLTGLSPDLLRAWERRYGVVRPLRTPGGTRRYRSSDLDRLRLLKAAVDAGHRISDVSSLDDQTLEQRVASPPDSARKPLDAAIEALERLDAASAEEIISTQLATLGPQRFVRRLAIPLLRRIGEEWEGERLCISSEHLGTSILRTLLGTALRPSSLHRKAPLVIFATPTGENHELGILIAALAALGAGVNPLYLGPELPTGEIVRAAETTRAAAVAIGIMGVALERNREQVREIRAGLNDDVGLWVGGGGCTRIEPMAGVEIAYDLDRLERLAERLLLSNTHRA